MNKVSYDQAHNFHIAFQLQNGCALLYNVFLIFFFPYFLISFIQQKNEMFCITFGSKFVALLWDLWQTHTVSLYLKPPPTSLTVYKTLTTYERNTPNQNVKTKIEDSSNLLENILLKNSGLLKTTLIL